MRPIERLEENERMSMRPGAQLMVTDLRRAARHPVDVQLIAEHRMHGDVPLRIVNLSAQGFMVRNVLTIGRGERLTVRLPLIGRIEAFLIWKDEDRAGFQFERVLRLDDFTAMIDQLQPNPRLRSAR